ncbi:MAG: hypothetical protein WA974_12465 [Thermodesulfobacteriota bacterium]
MNLFRLFKKEGRAGHFGGSTSLEKIFNHFTELLKENNETLELMADLEEKASGHFLFDMTYLRSTSNRIVEKVDLIINHLIELAPNRYEDLKEIYLRIFLGIQETLEKKKGIPQADYTLS